ncbi:Group 1 mite allergen-like protein (Cysteine protease) [Euroglyphus maynei]|uniref:Group 1 mite allergen-like protein (Cysteine protease) n=1 Tax=Euroglyphus maynei TaxID=6958 RepID=A0A1Y3BV87_EURMA|nr:Group 1 mite allergen-like protein (Cysteine protease) [Euroglyphus maynei]
MKIIPSSIAIAALLLSMVNARPASITTFEEFKQAFGKQYENIQQEMEARKNFLESLKFVRENRGAAINQLSDLSLEQFENSYMMSRESYEANIRVQLKAKLDFCDITARSTSASLDLRSLNHLTPIRDQGACGSCWAFAGVAAVESAYLAYKNQSLDLAEQELVDCAARFGCHGDTIPRGLDYIQEQGVVEEQVYEYNGRENDCEPPEKPRHSIKQYCQIDHSNVELIKTALDTHKAAVAVIINIHNINAFRHYDGSYVVEKDRGIFPHFHAVNIVGYGKSPEGIDYWIMRNSWSENWGENGYGYFEMDENLMQMEQYPYVILSL